MHSIAHRQSPLDRTPQRGNALFLILIAVALLAILSYAVTQSGRSNATIDKEKTELASGEILQYAGLVRSTILRLKDVNGCTDTTISFENSVEGGYANAAAPINKSCNVFDALGGGLKWQSPPAGTGSDKTYLFSGSNRLIPNDQISHLMMFLPVNSPELCQKINATMGNPSGLAQDWIADDKFTGSYTDNDSPNDIPDDGPDCGDGGDSVCDAMIGRIGGCLKDVGSDAYNDGTFQYFFYYVLIRRS